MKTTSRDSLAELPADVVAPCGGYFTHSERVSEDAPLKKGEVVGFITDDSGRVKYATIRANIAGFVVDMVPPGEVKLGEVIAQISPHKDEDYPLQE